MEGRRGHPPLAHVQRLFAGQQAIAQDEPRALHDHVAMVARLVVDQQFLDKVRMIELVNLAIDRAVMHHVAIAPGIFPQHVDRASAKEPAGKQAGKKRRAGRILRPRLGAYIWLCVHSLSSKRRAPSTD